MEPRARWLRRNWLLVCVVSVLGASSAVIDHLIGVQGGYGPALAVSAVLLGVVAFLDLRTEITTPF